MLYYNGLEELIKKKEAYKDLVTILRTDQGSVYTSKNFNKLAQINNIIHSMSAQVFQQIIIIRKKSMLELIIFNIKFSNLKCHQIV